MEIYRKLSRPPATALKTIKGGRLQGMSDVNPQWRYEALTEAFGPCGVGWKFTIDRLWTEPAPEGQVFTFAQVSIYIHHPSGNGWSEPIPGIGGNFLIEKERAGLHASDEGFKMAVTDALGTAAKMLGVAADIYAGRWDGSKYRDPPEEKQQPPEPQDRNAFKAPPQEPPKKPLWSQMTTAQRVENFKSKIDRVIASGDKRKTQGADPRKALEELKALGTHQYLNDLPEEERNDVIGCILTAEGDLHMLLAAQ